MTEVPEQQTNTEDARRMHSPNFHMPITIKADWVLALFCGVAIVLSFIAWDKARDAQTEARILNESVHEMELKLSQMTPKE